MFFLTIACGGTSAFLLPTPPVGGEMPQGSVSPSEPKSPSCTEVVAQEDAKLESICHKECEAGQSDSCKQLAKKQSRASSGKPDDLKAALSGFTKLCQQGLQLSCQDQQKTKAVIEKATIPEDLEGTIVSKVDSTVQIKLVNDSPNSVGNPAKLWRFQRKLRCYHRNDPFGGRRVTTTCLDC
jgi:cytochrome c5